MRYCDHRFVCISDLKIDSPAIVACLFCGQIRHVYSDGLIKIIVDEGKVEKKPMIKNDQN